MTTATTGFEFLHPWFLVLLLFLPALAWLRARRGGAATVRFPTVGRLAALHPPVHGARGGLLAGLMLFALAAGIIALARPQMVLARSETKTSGIDIVLVLDVSRSMLAEDFTIGNQRSNRLDAVKRVTEDFIKRRLHDRIGIVAFAGRAYVVSPVTLGHDWLLQNLERLRIGLVEDGTAIGSALASGTARLKDSKARSRILVLLTDGDNNAGTISPETAAEAAAALGVKIYTIGAGTRGVAPYPFQDPFGRIFYRNIEVEFDEEALRKIADTGGGRYFRATNTRSLEEIYREIDKLEKSELLVNQFREVRELFHWPLAVALVLMTLRLGLAETAFRRVP